MVDMKIVDEPSSFGLSNAFSQNSIQQEETLKLRVKPANFSGPVHFRRLVGRCFSSTINDYKYNFCPFANITQHEQGIHWNPYKGVLGVWQGWEVENNTFSAMMMKDGDKCDSIYRSVRVTFMCSNQSRIVNVSEPQTCRYLLVFQSPLVCQQHSMLVYPTLSHELQYQWDKLEGERSRELTTKGYHRRLAHILERAGILISSEQHKELVKQAENVKQENTEEMQFDSLATCTAEYKKLQDTVEALKTELGIGDQDTDTADEDFPTTV